MIVADASVLVEALVRRGPANDRLGSDDLAAPHLIDAEAGHALRRHVLIGQIDADAGRQALAELGQIEIERYGHVGLAARAWELRNNLSYYDALYIALAESLDAPLVTLDARLAGARGVRSRVEVLGVSNGNG